MSVENPINKSGQLGQTRLREFLIEDNFINDNVFLAS